MFLYTGLRVSELVALNQDDVIMGKRSGLVNLRKGKGDVACQVPLPVDHFTARQKKLQNSNQAKKLDERRKSVYFNLGIAEQQHKTKKLEDNLRKFSLRNLFKRNPRNRK
jgi:site-specific recombinase XerC